MGEAYVRCKETINYLGVTIDNNLNWREHIRKVTNKAKEMTHRMRGACRATWGLGRDAAKQIYAGAIEPAVTYAAAVWMDGCKKREKRQLRSAQRPALLGAAKAFKTVSTAAAAVIAEIVPLDIAVERAGRRWKYRNNDKMANKAMKTKKKEVDRIINTLGRIHPAEIGRVEYGTAEEEKRGICIYTDGSKTMNGTGAAISVWMGDKEEHHERCKLDVHNTVMQCETEAIAMALEYVLRDKRNMGAYTIITDSKSVLNKISSLRNPTESIARIKEQEEEVRKAGGEVNWIWVKAHAKSKGNDRADELAKKAADEEDTTKRSCRIPISGIKKVVEEETQRLWQNSWDTEKEGRWTWRLLPTVKTRGKTRVKINNKTTQLLTGHGRFGRYFKDRKVREEARCGCGDEEEDNAEHVLLRCRLENKARAKGRRGMREAGLRWPESIEEARRLVAKNQWWEVFAEFANSVEKLTLNTEGARGENTEGTVHESAIQDLSTEGTTPEAEQPTSADKEHEAGEGAQAKRSDHTRDQPRKQ